MTEPDRDRRVLVLAPTGRDAALAVRVLGQAGVTAQTCPDMTAFTRELDLGAAAGVVTDEALAPGPRAQLAACLARQPLWSDFPLIVCAGRAETRAGRDRQAALAAELGNASLVDRPIHPDALVGSVRSALRARNRQYQARELLDRLETAVREREEFLATLSHELRNPLGAIRAAVQLVQPAVPPDSRLQRPMAIIDRQSRHLGRLVDDLLEVARVTTGKVVLQRQAVDLRTILDSVVQQLMPSVEHQKLTLTASLPTTPCPVDGDPLRLEQIFTNLVTNAIKYTPHGGRVTVVLRDAGDKLVILVSDTGVGMTPETLPTIFDLFSQADRSLDRAQGGMGIGLTLVRTLTELHGGTVSAISDGLGKGSEFTITLPKLDQAPPAAVHRPRARGGKRHILIVEDSADNRDMLRDLLEYQGHRVEVASDGVEALQAAVRSRPEVALIDIGLPGINGYEVARRLRASLGRQIILVALTGYGRPEDRQRSAEAGFDRHLAKPPDLEELTAALWAR